MKIEESKQALLSPEEKETSAKDSSVEAEKETELVTPLRDVSPDPRWSAKIDDNNFQTFQKLINNNLRTKKRNDFAIELDVVPSYFEHSLNHFPGCFMDYFNFNRIKSIRGSITRVLYSPNQQEILVACDKHIIQLNAKTYQEMGKLTSFAGKVIDMGFSPSDVLIAITEDEISAWHYPTLEKYRDYKTAPGMQHLRMNPQADVFVVAANFTDADIRRSVMRKTSIDFDLQSENYYRGSLLLLYTLDSETPVHIQPIRYEVKNLEFSPDGESIIISQTNWISCIWDFAAEKLINLPSTIVDFDCYSDRKSLITRVHRNAKDYLAIFDMHDKKFIKEVRCDFDKVKVCDYNLEESLVLAVQGQKIMIFDGEELTAIDTLVGDHVKIESICASVDGSSLIALGHTQDSTPELPVLDIVEWHMERNDTTNLLQAITKANWGTEEKPIIGISFYKDEYLVVAFTNRVAIFKQADVNSKPFEIHNLHSDDIITLTIFKHSPKFVTLGKDNRMVVYNMSENSQISWEIHNHHIGGCDISLNAAEDRIYGYMGNNNGVVAMWDPENGNFEGDIALQISDDGHNNGGLTMSFGVDGDRYGYCGGYNGMISVVDLEMRKYQHFFRAGYSPIVKIVPYVDGAKLLVFFTDGYVRQFDWCHSYLSFELKLHDGGIACVAASPDHSKLAIAGFDMKVLIVDLETLQIQDIWDLTRILEVGAKDPTPREIKFSPDGQYIALAFAEKFLMKRVARSPYTLSYSYGIENNNESLEKSRIALTPFFNSDFTLLHYYCYVGSFDDVKRVLLKCRYDYSNQLPFYRDASGRSPIHYALERRFYDIVDLFLRELLFHSPLLLEGFEEIFADLIALDTPSSPIYLDSCLIAPYIPPHSTLRELPTRACLDGESNLITSSNKPFLEDCEYDQFLQVRKTTQHKFEDVDVRAMYVGKLLSSDLLYQILQNRATNFFHAESVQLILKWKWENYARSKFIGNYLIFLLYFLSFVALTIFRREGKLSTAILVVLAICTAFFSIREIKLIYTSFSFSGYFTNIWKYFDLILCISMIGVIYLELREIDTSSLLGFWTIAALSFWVKFFAFLRVQKGVGEILKAVTESTQAVICYTIILIISVIAFGHAFQVASGFTMITSSDPLSIFSGLLEPYMWIQGIGGEHGEFNGIEYTLFVVMGFFFLVVMANLVIALVIQKIMATSETRTVARFENWAQILSEIDVFLTQKDKAKFPQYLISAIPQKVVDILNAQRERVLAMK